MWDEQVAAETPARRRILEVTPIGGWTSVQIHVPSSRQLPTDHDHGGGTTRSPNISLINRRRSRSAASWSSHEHHHLVAFARP